MAGRDNDAESTPTWTEKEILSGDSPCPAPELVWSGWWPPCQRLLCYYTPGQTGRVVLCVLCTHIGVDDERHSTGAAAGVREAVHFLARFALSIAGAARPRPKACIRAPSTGALTSAPNTGAHTSHSPRPERPTDRLLLGCFIANASFPHKFASFSSAPPPPSLLRTA